MLDNILFNPNFNALLISYDDESARDLFQKKVQFAWEHFHSDLKSKYLVDSSRTNLLRLDLGHGNYSSFKVDSTGRSGTYQQLHVCLHPETKIILKNGYIKEIKDIKPGDLVLTSKGSYKKVIGLAINDSDMVNQQMLLIETYGSPFPLMITEEHRVLSRNRFRRSSFKFKRFDGKIYTQKLGEEGNAKWRKAKELKPGYYLAYPTREPSNKSRNNSLSVKGFDKKIPINYDLGYFVGFFLAEGHLKHLNLFSKRRKEFYKRTDTQLVFAMHKDELDIRYKFLEKFSNFYDKITTYEKQNSLTRTITLNSKILSQFLDQYFYDNGDKYIPDSVWNYGREFLDGLVKGIFDGDGSYKNLNQIQLTSARYQFVTQLKLILISLRFGYPTIYYRKAGKFYGRNCKETWTLKLNGEGNYKFRKYFNLPLPKKEPMHRKFWRSGVDYYWGQITKIERIEKPEKVYDIILDEDPHNYTTFNGVVHNSELGLISKNFPEKVDKIIRGTFPCVHPPKGQITIESTSEGPFGAFYDMFQTAYSKPQDHQYRPTEFKAFFFNWQWDQEALSHVKPSNQKLPREFLDIQKHHNELSTKNPQLYQQLTDLQLQYFFQLWEDECNRSFKKLFLEYPLTPEMAFQKDSRAVFDTDKLQQLLALTQSETLNPFPPPHDFKGWTFYGEIEPNHNYVLGADPSEGVSRDHSAAVLLDISGIKNRVVATFADNEIQPDIFAYELKNIAQLANHAFIIVERNNSGRTTLDTLKGIYPVELIYKEERTTKEEDEQLETLGFHMNLSTKPKIFYQLSTQINEDQIEIPSPELIKELLQVDRKFVSEVKVKDDGETTNHLDLTIALCLAAHGALQYLEQDDGYTVISSSDQPPDDPNSPL